MSVKLRPYPEYKESGVAWLGNIPSHWGTKPLKHLVGNVVVTTDEKLKDDAYVALENVEGWTGVVRPRMGTVEFDSQVKRFLSGDILFGKLRPYLAKVARPTCNGVCVGEFLVLRAKGGAVDAQLLEMQLRSPGFIGLVSSSAYGAKMPRAEWQFIGNIPMPCPPHDSREREAVVGYLTSVDRAIRSAIRAKRRQIGLLNEQKQVIINRVVTRGLEPTVRLKSSGIGWLGEIPEHWNVKRVQSLFRERNQRGRDDLPVLIVSLNTGITIAGVTDENGRPRRLIDDRRSYKVAQAGDVAYNMMRMWQGAVGVVPVDGLVSPAYVVSKPLPGVDPQYFTYVFRTDACKAEINASSRGIVSDRNRLYWTEFKNLFMPVPDLSEQGRIVQAITLATQRVNLSISYAQRGIDLLREYRTRLIADVVTGKLDVRGVELPDIEGIDVADDFGCSGFNSDTDQDDLPDAEEVEADGED